MDWGLFDLKSKDNKLLREETVYSSNVSHTIHNSHVALPFTFHNRNYPEPHVISVVLLFWHGWRFNSTIWLDIIHVFGEGWLCGRRTYDDHFKSIWSISSIYLELFSIGEWTFEQLWQISSGQRYIGGSNGLLWSSRLIDCTTIKIHTIFSLKTFPFHLQVTILRMMDDEHGVINRRTKNKLAKKRSELRMLFQTESADEIE